MSERGGNNGPAVVAVAAVLALLFFGLLTGPNYNWDGSNNRSAQQAGAAPEEPKPRNPITNPNIADSEATPEPHAQPNREEWRQEQDLLAQSAMAIWTRNMGVAAIVGLVLSTAGIGLILGNLLSTNRMIVATREIGENQSKAYAWVPEALVSFPDDGESGEKVRRLPGKPGIRVKLTARNDGETPATDVTASATLKIFSRSGNAFAPISMEYEGSAIKNPKVRIVTQAKEEPLWLFIADNRKPKALNAFATKNWAARFGGHQFEIVGELRYRDVFKHWYKSEFKFIGTVKNDGLFNPAWRSEDPEILFVKVKAQQENSEDEGQN